MREIKFRAWVKGHMAYSSSVFEMMFQDGHYFYHGGESHAPKAEDVAIMQYTGLKDCNGVEIYEGDIIEVEDYYNNSEKSGIFAVSWYDRHSGWRFNTCVAFHDFYISEYKVIGNIYENPELLEDAE